MTIAITRLPRIVEILAVGDVAQFVVLDYNEFVEFVADASAANAPDAVAVLDHGGDHAFVVLLLASFAAYIRKLDIVGGVDERHYLTAYPDVKAAIDDGRLQSGTQHYIIAGYFEKRAVKYRDTA